MSPAATEIPDIQGDAPTGVSGSQISNLAGLPAGDMDRQPFGLAHRPAAPGATVVASE
ncbi:hypothetical protein LR393_26890 [Kineosporia mesophila]|uniref:hypothetical protein n=1 Tax=Kineosporia mesophila TaxID=566012 RepID=UPI001E3D77F3|nr:hypothetical protein [Kineosporia mesophila]MCD5353709.1 hypothetical protein [Kineosporia mesophila]